MARRITRLAATVALTSASGALPSCTTPAPPAPISIPGRDDSGMAATVVAVVDGDTVELRFPDGTSDRVRLLGIDTPETVKPDAPVECFGPEASDRAKALLPAGTAVLVQRDTEVRDLYGRLLLYVWRRHDGLFVNASLIADGYARTLSIAPNNAYRIQLSALAAEARDAKRGLWGACEPEG